MMKRYSAVHELQPEDILLDSSNLPFRDTTHFEGRVAGPVSRRALGGVGIVFLLILIAFGSRAYYLQVMEGNAYSVLSINNTLHKSVVFALRGTITDRTGRELAWNTWELSSSTESTSTPSAIATTSMFALRQYTSLPGLAHVLGYLRYPQKDNSGKWWQPNYIGIAGVENSLDSLLQGTNGSSISETDAHGHSIRNNIIQPPIDGQNITLSIDASIQSKLNQVLEAHASQNGFQGGAAVIMDVRTGQIIALTSFPEYDNQAYVDGNNAVIAETSKNVHFPLLDRAIAGLYAPGSIVKPIFAAAALKENIISPDKQIDSIGAITLPNPYSPANPSIFRDWAVHGWIDMRTALAVSSDEYFYTIGGGYGGQQGLGIARIDKYAALFGLASKTGINLPNEQVGVIPSPDWKAVSFAGNEPWRIGDTYHTAIGQYGFQITPVQAVRFIAAIANGGNLLTPQILASSTPVSVSLGIPDSMLQIVREGMHMAVTSTRPDATVKVLNIPGFSLAAKTGTAQIGAHNEWMNSWSVGFWPVDHPRYAYAVVLERAPAHTASGAAPGMYPFFQWLIATHPEYIGDATNN
ncbi:MAG: penicillin-binding protein 2, penicillin-binding protein 2 [Candidatus Kaiserbacteria bacterium]|nr:penicillin-binding protein 2, penicillin-binding protein 2 [Candidatus Kaiserbacteria bacterium]